MILAEVWPRNRSRRLRVWEGCPKKGLSLHVFRLPSSRVRSTFLLGKVDFFPLQRNRFLWLTETVDFVCKVAWAQPAEKGAGQSKWPKCVTWEAGIHAVCDTWGIVSWNKGRERSVNILTTFCKLQVLWIKYPYLGIRNKDPFNSTYVVSVDWPVFIWCHQNSRIQASSSFNATHSVYKRPFDSRCTALF